MQSCKKYNRPLCSEATPRTKCPCGCCILPMLDVLRKIGNNVNLLKGMLHCLEASFAPVFSLLHAMLPLCCMQPACAGMPWQAAQPSAMCTLATITSFTQTDSRLAAVTLSRSNIHYNSEKALMGAQCRSGT